MPINRRVEEHRRRHDQTAVLIEDHAGEIARLANDGGIAGAIEMVMHLLHQATDAVANDLGGDGIYHSTIPAFQYQVAIAVDRGMPIVRHYGRRIELFDN